MTGQNFEMRDVGPCARIGGSWSGLTVSAVGDCRRKPWPGGCRAAFGGVLPSERTARFMRNSLNSIATLKEAPK